MKGVAPSSARTGKHWLLAVSYAASVACLYWTLRDAHLGEFKDDLADMKWSWLVVAAVADVAVYCWQALRWQTLLWPVEHVPYKRTLRAIYTGLFANEILPFRAGEVLRCYLLSARSRLPFSVFLSSALVERVFDGIWLCALMPIALRAIPNQGQLRYIADGAFTLAFFVALGAVVLAIALFRRDSRSETTTPVPSSGWRRQFAMLSRSLTAIGHSRSLYISFAQSLPYLLLQVIPVWATFRGYGFDLSIGAALTLMVVLRLGAVVPQAPGNLGLFQFLAKEVLQLVYHVPADEAARFSLLLWGVVTLPLLGMGAVAFAITGTRFADLRRAAEHEASELD